MYAKTDSGCGLKQGLQNSARFHVRRSDCNDKTSPFDFHSVYNQYKEIWLVDHCTSFGPFNLGNAK